MKEDRFLEFKSEITNSFLKTVSAYSNIGTGLIRFGYNNNGTVWVKRKFKPNFLRFRK